MGIRTCKRCRQHVLSKRSPVKTLLNSEFQSAVNWLARRTDKKTGTKPASLPGWQDGYGGSFPVLPRRRAIYSDRLGYCLYYDKPAGT